jgi:hypothetical protein
MYTVGMTLPHILLGIGIILIGLVFSLDRWAWAFPRFGRWFTRHFPRASRILITREDERRIK